MCPLVVLDDRGELVLAAGSAGASRIRSALVHTLVNVLLDGLPVVDAVHHPRFHVVADTVHAYVVHAAPRRGVGLQFVGASDLFRSHLDEYLNGMP